VLNQRIDDEREGKIGQKHHIELFVAGENPAVAVVAAEKALHLMLNTSEDAIQRFLQRKWIQLSRIRTWCISTDPEFAGKAADIVGLYLAPPVNYIKHYNAAAAPFVWKKRSVSGSQIRDTISNLRQRLLPIEGELSELIQLESQDGNQGNHDAQFEKLYGEKVALKAKLEQIQRDERHAGNEQARLTEVIAGMDKLRSQPIAFDNMVVRQMVECVRVLSKDRLRISFRLGGEMDVTMA